MNFEQTDYGFIWGPVEIQRHIENKGSIVLGLKTYQCDLDIYITPKGHIKIYVPIGAKVELIGSAKI